MNLLKNLVQMILPHSLGGLFRRIRHRNRLCISPTPAQFTDPETTLKAVGTLDSHWKRRIRAVVSCPDNQAIPRCKAAGSLRDGFITMHNGLKVGGFSYYGAGIMNLLMQNKGVHEPQEERAFQDVLPWIAHGSSMLELGSYWGFYSLWFSKSVVDAKNYLVEPAGDNLEAGRVNFRLNGKQAVFENAYVGAADQSSNHATPTISVDSFLKRQSITKLAILHSDVQGAELDMLRGATQAFERRVIDFCFVSTHTNELHLHCLAFFERNQYRILASANLDQSYAEDGLIVAISPVANGPEKLLISFKD